MKIRLERVRPDKKATLYRLLQYSLFEESSTDLNEMNEEGIFEYKWFDYYFRKRNNDPYDRDAYFIRHNKEGRLLGFVMVNTYLQIFKEGHSIAEFLIIPKYRRMGAGRMAATEIFDMYGGNWEVSPSYGSESAYKFWKDVINKYTGGHYKFEDETFLFIKDKCKD